MAGKSCMCYCVYIVLEVVVSFLCSLNLSLGHPCPKWCSSWFGWCRGQVSRKGILMTTQAVSHSEPQITRQTTCGFDRSACCREGLMYKIYSGVAKKQRFDCIFKLKLLLSIVYIFKANAYKFLSKFHNFSFLKPQISRNRNSVNS